MDISIVLPTLRIEQAKACIERIIDSTKDITYEIIVVTPFEMDLDYDCIKKVKDSREGCVKAFCLGAEAAEGDYIINLSDEQMIEKDCLRNILNQMREHDGMLYMCGPRQHDLWENTTEQTIYDHYYPINPCIKRSNLEKIGGVFFDPYYIDYYSDPDVALRVIQAGGKVEICSDAWVTTTQTHDEVENNKREKYFQADHDRFIARWHKIYGKEAMSNSWEINKGVRILPQADPYEMCARLIGMIRNKENDKMVETFIFKNRYSLNKMSLPLFLGYILAHLDRVPRLVDSRNCPLQRVIFPWIINNMRDNPVIDFHEVEGKIPKSAFAYRNLLVACYFIMAFRLSRKDNNFLFIKNFKDHDISYLNGEFISRGHRSSCLTELLMKINYINPNTPDIDYLELRIMEEFLKNDKEPIVEKIYSAVDYFCNRPIEEIRNGKITGQFWSRTDWDASTCKD